MEGAGMAAVVREVAEKAVVGLVAEAKAGAKAVAKAVH
jgi:hypothetical protein